jgi:peptidoglycan/xylan/chitin deacetylase (PgdA/CDA1 family)
MTTPRAGLPVLTYHTIDDRRSVTATDPAWFEETLCSLLDAGFRAVDLGDWLARGRPNEPGGFAVTFDDGLKSVLRVADLLARNQVPATVFVVTGRVGTDNAWRGQRNDVAVEPLLSWSELSSLAGAGFQVAAHGSTHTPLDRLDDASLARELRECREAVEDRLGRPCKLLAYPDGSSSPRVRLAAAREFEAGFGTTLGYADGGQDLFDLARVDAYYLRTRRVLDALINDRARGWLRLRRALRAVRRQAGPVLPSWGARA